MRQVLALALLLAFAAACAGPRLTAPPTAHLPAPIVRRVEQPAVPTQGVPWPVVPAAEAAAFCVT